MQRRIAESEKSRTSLIKERGHLEKINKEIEETFHQYKRECKQKEKDLMERLEKAHRQIKGTYLHYSEDRKLIDQLEQIRLQVTVHQKRIG